MSPRKSLSTTPPRDRAAHRLGHRAAHRLGHGAAHRLGHRAAHGLGHGAALPLAVAGVPVAAIALAATALAATAPAVTERAVTARAATGPAANARAVTAPAATAPAETAPAETAPAETARLRAALVPDRPGQSTTVVVDLAISAPRGRTPSPVASFDLHAPAGLNLLSSQLGLATCTRRTLVVRGRNGCSANSLLGRGRASAEVASAAGVLGAGATLTAFFGGTEGDALSVLLDIHVGTPVYGRVVIPSRLLADSAPFGTQLETPVPPIAVGPEGPYVAITHLHMTLGPLGLTYYRPVHGRRTGFTPTGPPVPTPCPRGGYPFAVSLHFADGTAAAARSVVRCPAPRR
jgi:hypothetical protein